MRSGGSRNSRPSAGIMGIKGVIFDMDGTIVDVPYNWPQIKASLDTQGKPILIYLQGLSEPERSEKWAILERYENEATQQARMKEGMREFLDFLSGKQIKIALVTNNSRRNVRILLRRFSISFDIIISRESGLWKPSASPFLAVLQEWMISREECCVVGDTKFDIEAAEAAGIPKIFILTKDQERFQPTRAEVIISVHELRTRIEKLF